MTWEAVASATASLKKQMREERTGCLLHREDSFNLIPFIKAK